MHHPSPAFVALIGDGNLVQRQYRRPRRPLPCRLHAHRAFPPSERLMRLAANTTATTTMPGKVVSHQAVEM